MASGFFNVGVTGLNAAQAGMLTAGHNISNASTPGFNRQEIVQTSNTPLFTGSGFLGQGTNIQTVRRVYSDFLSQQMLSAENNVAEMSTYATEINQIDNMLGDPSLGLGPALQGFFDAANQVASDPASVPARQSLLSSAQGLAERFHGLDQQLAGMRAGVNTQIGSEIGAINSIVGQIANLNQRIMVAQSASANQVPNDLYDQRDQLVSDLNKEVSVKVQTESNGSYSLFFGTGQPLVVGTQTFQLVAMPAPEDLSQLEIGLKSPGGQIQTLPESLVTGGNLGGLLAFRAQSLDQAQNALGRIALAVTDTVNYQSRLGQDLSGQPGGDFFTPLNLDVLGAPSNGGAAALSANVVVSDYRVVYDGTNYNVTRLADNTTTQFGQLPFNIDGVEISLTSGIPAGTANNPDVFMVTPSAPTGQRVTRMAGNPDNAALDSSASNLQSLSTSDYRLTLSGTNTFTLTRLSDNQTWTSGGTDQQSALADVMAQAGALGFNLSLSANTAAVGDSYLIRPTRTAARDFGVALADPLNIAAAAPIRTGAAVTNAGTGSITAGAVSNIATPLATSFDVRYEKASDSLIGFPAGAKVVVGNTTYAVTDATTRIPYSAGATISVDGVGVVIGGAPADGDVFTIAPPGTAPSIPANTGLGTMFGAPTATTRGATVGTLVGAPGTIPLTFAAGVDDQFDISIDGGPTQTITLNSAQPYADSAALVSDIQAQVTGFGLGATVSLVNGQIMISSATTGAGSSVALSATPLVPGPGSNTALDNLFGVAPNAGNRGLSTGSISPGNPIAILQSSNDRFSIAVDGVVPATTLAIPAGTYTPATLAAQMQASLDSALGAGKVTVSINGGKLEVTSNTVGAASAVTLAAGTNTGTGTIGAGTATTTASLPIADIALTFKQANTALGLPDRLTGLPVGSVVTVTPPGGGAPTQYAIGKTTDYVPFTSGATLAFGGVSFAINGAPADGDMFTVGANSSGAGDGRNILAIQGLQSINTLSEGSASFATSYAQLVSTVGNKAREIGVTQTAQESLVKQTQDAVQSMSGVNLDEEAANLMRFQQAYQASAKMLEMAGKLFDTILATAQ